MLATFLNIIETSLLSVVCLFESNIFQNTDSPLNYAWFSNNIYSDMHINYANRNVLTVIINNKDSLSFKKYEAKDFGLTNNVLIEDLTEGYKDKIQTGYSKSDIFKRIIRITFPNARSLKTAAIKIKQLDFVDDVEIISDASNNDLYVVYPNEKTTSGTQYNNQYYLNTINAPQAWDYCTGSTSTVVGLIDTGVYSSHQDLSNGQISSSLSFTLNGTNNSPLDDLHGHGTVNAGIIGATANNYLGISGICWNITIASLRVDNPSNPTYPELPDHVAAAFNKADELNIPIVNYSGGSYTESLTLKQAILNYDGLVVVAAGNGGYNLNNTSCYPTSWNLSNVISVGATDSSNSMASFSNYSSQYVHLMAPGVNITSTFNTSYNCYVNDYAGTSESAPMVTAAAALLKSLYPTMAPNVIKRTLIDNVTTVSSLSNKCLSGGVLNISNALINPHSHDYTSSFTYISSLKHRANCSCGNYILEIHAWDYGETWEVGYQTYGMCQFCGHGFPL